jgi:hypothetical protein
MQNPQVPDYVYSTAIQTLIAKSLLDEALTVSIQAYLSGVVLEIPTFEQLMHALTDNNYEPTYLAMVFTMFNDHFTPSKKMYFPLTQFVTTQISETP